MSSQRHYIKHRGKIIEMADAEYLARANRIAKIRSEYALERAQERQREAQGEKSKAEPPDPYTPGLNRLGDYMRQRGI